MANLKGFQFFTKLTLRSGQITDAGLAGLEGVVISELTIGGPKVTDAGLKYLQKVPGLSVMNLRWNTIRGSGLRYLEKQPERIASGEAAKLHSVSLNNATDETLKCVARIKSLDDVCLYNPRFTAEGIRALRNMAELAISNCLRQNPKRTRY